MAKREIEIKERKNNKGPLAQKITEESPARFNRETKLQEYIEYELVDISLKGRIYRYTDDRLSTKEEFFNPCFFPFVRA